MAREGLEQGSHDQHTSPQRRPNPEESLSHSVTLQWVNHAHSLQTVELERKGMWFVTVDACSRKLVKDMAADLQLKITSIERELEYGLATTTDWSRSRTKLRSPGAKMEGTTQVQTVIRVHSPLVMRTVEYKSRANVQNGRRHGDHSARLWHSYELN